MEGSVELKEVAAQNILGIRFRTSVEKIKEDIVAKFGAMFAYLGELGQPPAGMPLALYYGGNDFDPNDFETELCVPVAVLPEGKGEVVARELAGGTMASAIHKGPYDKMEATYALMESWVDRNGYYCSGPVREIYMNDPSQVPESELLTEVQYPVAKK